MYNLAKATRKKMKIYLCKLNKIIASTPNIHNSKAPQ